MYYVTILFCGFFLAFIYYVTTLFCGFFLAFIYYVTIRFEGLSWRFFIFCNNTLCGFSLAFTISGPCGFILCLGASKGSTGSGFGFKGSQFKVKSDSLLDI